MFAAATAACNIDMQNHPLGVAGTAGIDTAGSGAGDGDGGEDDAPEAEPAVRVQLRRLTREQYNRSIQQLLGADVALPMALPPDAVDHHFTTVGTAPLPISSFDVEQYEAAAVALADAIVDDETARAALVGCDPATAACLDGFVDSFGRLAFRRTLSATETQRYHDLAQAAAARFEDPWQGVHATLSAVLASPNFLYIADVGEPDPEVEGRRRYTSVEMASRLSFFLWGHGPDAALLDRAEAGDLDDAQTVAEIAADMMAQPAARDGMGRFFREWLSIEAMSVQTKDTEVFADATPELFVSMAQEIEQMVEHLVFEADESMLSLLDTRTAFVDDRLAAIYGMEAQGGGMVAVQRADDDPRVGMLGTAAVLSLTSRRARTAPTLRGIYVQQRWRCVDLPPPPPDVDVEIPDNPEDEPTPATMREMLEEHDTNPACASCHSVVDPLGLALEHFDAMGRWRSDDRGMTIDDSGKLGDAEFHGLAELVALLREDPEVETCVTRQLYRYATGHLEQDDQDGPAIVALADDFAAAEGRLSAFVPKLVSSTAFRTFAEVEP
ncbi:MAG: DUF1592 domain-containing protein [Nannocystaceae bacterium]|nr:DUF1592 domain-containing protein [Nannocystaceae bacterium]